MALAGWPHSASKECHFHRRRTGRATRLHGARLGDHSEFFCRTCQPTMCFLWSRCARWLFIPESTESPRMFQSDFIDLFSRTHPVMVPILYVPGAIFGFVRNMTHGGQ